ncbi:MAG: helix-turn-helix domain-containing protein [Chloroflexota bacterium]|nr:helix-turn-helix domain-containing protein [Chloroflexota bacterium]
MDFGSKVRELRLAKRLTQRDFADRLKVDFSYISKIENNKVEHQPSAELIQKMAQVLDADVEELLDLAGKIDQEQLRKTVAETPSVGILLRRLQNSRLTPEQIEAMMKIIEESSDG